MQPTAADRSAATFLATECYRMWGFKLALYIFVLISEITWDNPALDH